MIIGEKKNRLTLIEILGRNSNEVEIGLFKCDCGKEKEITVNAVKYCGTKSCGCLNIEKIKERSTTHGMSKTNTYQIWLGMKKRCYGVNSSRYHYYGGRGITICDEWINSFEQFYTDMGKRPSKNHSIDRIDNRKGYSRDNCRWVTQKVQTNNKRNNVILTAYGVTQNITEWSETLEIPSSRIFDRIRMGWSDHDALFTPKKKNKYI